MMSVAYGEGRYEVHATALACGNDMTVVFTGGERPHVGAASLAVYEPERDSATVSTITCFGHRDDELSRHAAKRIATALKCTACVSLGVHVDSASEEEIQQIRDNYQHCLSWLLSLIENR